MINTASYISELLLEIVEGFLAIRTTVFFSTFYTNFVLVMVHFDPWSIFRQQRVNVSKNIDTILITIWKLIVV